MNDFWTKYADVALVGIALMNGVSYPIAKWAMSTEWGRRKCLFLSLRFMLVTAILFPFASGEFFQDPTRYAMASTLVGLSLVATFGFQYWAFSVKGTTSGSVAFVMACKVALALSLTEIDPLLLTQTDPSDGMRWPCFSFPSRRIPKRRFRAEDSE